MNKFKQVTQIGLSWRKRIISIYMGTIGEHNFLVSLELEMGVDLYVAHLIPSNIQCYKISFKIEKNNFFIDNYNYLPLLDSILF